MREAFRPESRGALHRMLGVPEGESIPLDLILEAIRSPEKFYKDPRWMKKLVRRARLALTGRRISKRAAARRRSR